MKTQRTWATIIFTHEDASVEASINYQTKSYCISQKNEDQHVVFKSDSVDGLITTSINRAKCVTAALKYIKKEFNL